MNRPISMWVLAGTLIVLAAGTTRATTRDIAELEPARLTFGQSILNQLTHGTYRDPFDELQTRPYNLLFANIGRHSNLSPWQGQQGSYTRYLNALIGNNGTANVDNDADTIQGALIRRESAAFAWGVSAAFLSGSNGGNDSNLTTTFTDANDLAGFDLRVAAARQVSERRVLGAGVRVMQATRELTESNFEQGVGGFLGTDAFDQTSVLFDVGLRHFRSSDSSWEAQVVVGLGSSEQRDFSETLDDAGIVTDRFVSKNYEISDLSLGLYAGYNRLRPERLGETSFRIGLERAERELDNVDLSYADNGGAVTPSLTLLGQEALGTTEVELSARTVFAAGETEMFTGAELGYVMVDGATQVDAAGLIVEESIEDTGLVLGLTLGLRQPIFGDRFRFIVSGRADLLDQERITRFDSAGTSDDLTRSTAQYAIGVEGVLANVNLDIAWLLGEEAPVVPVDLGLPSGSRRSVRFDRLVFSAAVSW